MVRDMRDRRLCVNRGAGDGTCSDCGCTGVKWPYKRCFSCFEKRQKEEEKEKEQKSKTRLQLKQESQRQRGVSLNYVAER